MVTAPVPQVPDRHDDVEEIAVLGRLACLVGRHRWEPFANPEAAPATRNLVCARCGKDQPRYDPPGGGQVTGLGGGGGG
jgi:hypothetical protein